MLSQDYAVKFRVYQTFSGAAIIGRSAYPSLLSKYIRVVVEGVGGSNTVIVRGRIFGQAAWVDLLTITGTSAGTTVETEFYDQLQFACGVYDASGTPTLIASGFPYPLNP